MNQTDAESLQRYRMRSLLLLLVLISSILSKSLFPLIESQTRLQRSVLRDTLEFTCIDDKYRTPLMYSAFVGKDTIVQQLLNAGASISETSQLGSGINNALTWAIHSGKLSTVKLLAEAGAPYIANSGIILPLDVRDKKCPRYLGSPMSIAAYNKSEDAIKIVEYLIRTFPTSANEKNPGENSTCQYSPLLWAVLQNNQSMVDTLLSLGADPDYVCFDYNISALSIALEKNYKEMFTLLLDRGADPSIYDGSKKRLSLLNVAILNNKKWAVEALLIHGVNIHDGKKEVSSYIEEMTAPILAMSCRNNTISNYLLDTLSPEEIKPHLRSMIIVAARHKDISMLKKLFKRENSILKDIPFMDSVVQMLIKTDQYGTSKSYQYLRKELKIPYVITYENEEESIIDGVKLLDSMGVSFDSLFYRAKIKDKSILHIAIERDFAKLLKHFDSMGAELTREQALSSPFLHLALKSSAMSCAIYMIEMGIPLSDTMFPSLDSKDMEYAEFLFFYNLLQKEKDFRVSSGEYLFQAAIRNGFTKEIIDMPQNGISPYLKHASEPITEMQMYERALKSKNPKTLHTIFQIFPPSDSVFIDLQKKALQSKEESLLIPFLQSLSHNKKTIYEILGMCKTAKSTEYILNSCKPLFNDSIRTEFYKDAPYHREKRRVLFSSGITLSDSLHYRILSNVVKGRDSLMLKEIIKKRLPLRVTNPSKKIEYSLPNALIKIMTNSRDKELYLPLFNYLEAQGLSLNDKEKYSYIKYAIKLDSLELFKDLFSKVVSIDSNESKEIHFLRIATHKYSFKIVNYLLDQYKYSSQDVSQIIIELFDLSSNYKPDAKRALLERLFALSPDYEAFNVSPSSLPYTLLQGNGKRDVYFMKRYLIPIFKKGYGLNVQTSSGKTALHTLVEKTDSTGIQLSDLLQWGADPNCVDTQGRTPLYAALEAANPEATKMLLQYGTDINKTDKKSKTILTRYFFNKKGFLNPRIYDDAKKRERELLEILLAHGADPYVLHENKTSEVLQLLFSSKSDLWDCFGPYIKKDVVDKKGNGFLHLVAQKGKGTKAFDPFLKNGLDVNKRNCYGMDPLRYAISNQDISIKPLLKAGVDIHAKDSRGGGTPLYYAVLQENIEAVELLLEAGADPHNTHKEDDLSSLYYSIKSIDIISQLYKHGAAFASDSTKMQYLLHTMVAHGRYQIVLALLHYGADPYRKNALGEDAFDMVKKIRPNKQEKFNELLRSRDELPPLPDFSREPLAGTWELYEREFRNLKTDSLLMVVQMSDKKSQTITFTKNRVGVSWEKESHRYSRTNEEIHIHSPRDIFLTFSENKITQKYQHISLMDRTFVNVVDRYRKKRKTQ